MLPCLAQRSNKNAKNLELEFFPEIQNFLFLHRKLLEIISKIQKPNSFWPNFKLEKKIDLGFNFFFLTKEMKKILKNFTFENYTFNYTSKFQNLGGFSKVNIFYLVFWSIDHHSIFKDFSFKSLTLKWFSVLFKTSKIHFLNSQKRK
jgi:hypothetical protein